MKAVAEAWSKFTDAQKKPFIKMHEDDVKRFEKEKKDLETKGFFIDKDGNDSRKLGMKEFAKHAAVQPKRPMTSYMFFM